MSDDEQNNPESGKRAKALYRDFGLIVASGTAVGLFFNPEATGQFLGVSAVCSIGFFMSGGAMIPSAIMGAFYDKTENNFFRNYGMSSIMMGTAMTAAYFGGNEIYERHRESQKNTSFEEKAHVLRNDFMKHGEKLLAPDSKTITWDNALAVLPKNNLI